MRFVFIFLFLISCQNEKVSKYWKYSKGYHFGDMIILSSNNLRNDTIFEVNKPIGVILSERKAYLGFSGKLEIKSIETNKIGFYVDKGIKIVP